jgi:transcription-repair coupling factor (superfamily II helicase)
VDKPADLLKLTSGAPSIGGKLQRIRQQKRPVAFSHVIESAQPFVVATIARHVDQTIWVLCPNVRTQELFFETLLNWLPTAQFLPEAEFAALENILPDPELTAERLGLLLKIDQGAGRQVIITTRASLDQVAPKPGSLRSVSMTLSRGART